MSGSTGSEEPGGADGTAVEEVAAAVEEVVPPVDVVYGCVIAGLGDVYAENAEIIVILLSLDKTSI